MLFISTALASNMSFFKGSNRTKPETMKTLADLSTDIMTLGYHECEFCKWSDSNYGNGEIWIKINNVFWTMPRMIWHYMDAHNYKMPEEVDLAIFNNSFSLVRIKSFEDFKLIVKNKIKIGLLDVSTEWKEQKFSNMTTLRRTLWNAKWSGSEIWTINGNFIEKFNFEVISKFPILSYNALKIYF